jgi:hypothetical protein
MPGGGRDVDTASAVRRVCAALVIVGAVNVAGLIGGTSASAATTPTIVTRFAGPADPLSGPPDATLAAGPHRIVELVNSRYAIVSRTGTGVAGGTMHDFVGATTNVFLSDPQVAWDPASNRFYYSIFENHGDTGPDEGIAWGFSKVAAPNSVGDFCHYFTRFNYGTAAYPDRPSLGFTADFLMFVSERVNLPGESFGGVDLAWVSKPKPGTSCPTDDKYHSGVTSLLDNQGRLLSYGTAVRQVDPGSTGWVITQPQQSRATLLLYRITKNGNGVSVSRGLPQGVPTYQWPQQAPQAGLTAAGQPAPMLETKGYLTQAYSAIDPRTGHIDIWTAHGVSAGAGAAVRWYEIDPTKRHLDQVGTVKDNQLYIFNGTIAPDRLVNGGTRAFGSNMVMTFTTSSTATDPAIGIISKRAIAAPSPIKFLQHSPGPNVDYDCFQPTRSACRWGDYSGTSPDPGAPARKSTGQVWLTNQWNVKSTDDMAAAWRTLTALAKP